jgi:diguanylate cyclase (GGDEF)-like protein/hemerythrin-like metal-binding protein
MKNIRTVLSTSDREKQLHPPNEYGQPAYHDPLTGLPTRHLFLDRMSRELARVRRYDTCFALMMLNLDEFSSVNNSNGYEVGDMVLCGVAKHMMSSVRDVDTVARLRGDEFAILLDGVANKKEAEIVALKIIQSVSIPIHLGDGKHIKIGASVGIVLSPHDGFQAEQLMLSADQAMNHAKSNGKGLIGFSRNEAIAPGKSKHSVSEVPAEITSLGISILDEQHKALAKFSQGIIDSLANGDKSTKLAQRVDLLFELCQMNFRTEEDLMNQYNITGLDQLQAEHRQELKKLRKIFGNLNFNEQDTVLVELEIEAWLLGLIHGETLKLATSLKAKGVT